MSDPAYRIARLRAATELVANDQHLAMYGSSIGVEVSTTGVDVHVHGCTPGELEASEQHLDDCEVKRDDYGHTRYVTAMRDGIEVTLYHR